MQTYADEIAQALSFVGCDKAFGVFGANIHHIWKALHFPAMTVYHFRHESGAAFAAAEYSIRTGKCAIVFVTSGPGITNAITGLRCARADRARIVFIAGLTGEETSRTGRCLIQETLPLDVEGLTGTTVHSALSYYVIIRDELDVKRLRQALVRIRRNPLGGVLGVFLTGARSQALIAPLQPPPQSELFPSPSLSKEALVASQKVAERFEDKSCLLWIGYGCRGASTLVKQLAERYALPVIATPRAKGIFPENHPLYRGTTGLGESADLRLRTKGPKGVLLLGSRAAELSSMFIQEKWANTDFYCVGLETSEVRRNMPESSNIIEAEISLFLEAVLEIKSMKETIAYRPMEDAIIQPVAVASKAGIHPVTVMSVIQDIAINGSGCSIISDVGNLYWTAHYLKFPKHGLFRSNLDSSPMGHAVCGVVGMGLADKHAVAIVSDAAMLTQSEVSTAVLYRSKAIWLVMSGSRYTWGDIPPPNCIPHTDFELLALAVDCEGCKVTDEEGLRKALTEALARDGPTVINVIVDSPPVAPSKV